MSINDLLLELTCKTQEERDQEYGDFLEQEELEMHLIQNELAYSVYSYDPAF